jgi:hypothetical protein
MARTTRLEIEGRIKFDQFWPDGKSDADTTKLLLTVNSNSMRVRPAGQTNFVSTLAYQEAGILGAVDEDTGKRKITPIIKSNTMTIRLQRIDAPELHYRPDTRGSEGALKGTGLIKDYRQHQAETPWSSWRNFCKASALHRWIAPSPPSSKPPKARALRLINMADL